jgi:uncharacterized integral membrane protein
VTFLSWLVGLPLAAIVLLFALSNRQDVALGLWPFDDGVVLPVYLIVLLPLLLGFVAGALASGLKGLKYRRLARQQTKRAEGLEHQLDAVRASATANPALPPPSSGDRSLSL